MKILIVSEPGRDGVFRHVESLAHTLIASGVKVSYAYSSIRSSEANVNLASHIESCGGSTLDLKVGNAPVFEDMVACLKLLRLIWKFKPDIVHAHSSKAGGLCRIVAKLIPHLNIVYSPHAYFGMGVPLTQKIRFFSLVEMWLSDVGVTINVSQSERDYARLELSIDPNRLVTVHNGIDLTRFPQANYEEKIRARDKLGIDPYARVVCVVARKSYQKNLEFLYEAVSAMRSSDPSIVLLHVGEGDMDPEIRKYNLEGSVVRIPYLAETHVAYAAADCFALSSRYEGLPISVIEALSSGLPVLLSDVKGNSEFFKLGFEAVQYSKLESPSDFASALSSLMQHSAAPFPQHTTRASQLFDQKQVLRAILKIYKHIVSIQSDQLPRDNPSAIRSFQKAQKENNSEIGDCETSAVFETMSH